MPALALPADAVVYASGAYAGRTLDVQIDRSGHAATQFDIAVDSPDRPVALILGAYDPAIWNLRWSEGTRIVAVFVTGYHVQALSGLPASTPTLVSTYDGQGACGHNYVDPQKLEWLNPMARRLFGREVTRVYPAGKDGIVLPEAPTRTVRWITSPDRPPASHVLAGTPLAGRAGLEDAVAKGILRKATIRDVAAWKEDQAALDAQKLRDVPPVAPGKLPRIPTAAELDQEARNVYVVLKPFVYPAGLYGGNGAVFIVPKGHPLPSGEPGHSSVLDWNARTCSGLALCGRLE